LRVPDRPGARFNPISTPVNGSGPIGGNERETDTRTDAIPTLHRCDAEGPKSGNIPSTHRVNRSAVAEIPRPPRATFTTDFLHEFPD
jgi:hypothetical protein